MPFKAVHIRRKQLRYGLNESVAHYSFESAHQGIGKVIPFPRRKAVTRKRNGANLEVSGSFGSRAVLRLSPAIAPMLGVHKKSPGSNATPGLICGFYYDLESAFTTYTVSLLVK
jgi:hypothetical protein